MSAVGSVTWIGAGGLAIAIVACGGGDAAPGGGPGAAVDPAGGADAGGAASSADDAGSRVDAQAGDAGGADARGGDAIDAGNDAPPAIASRFVAVGYDGRRAMSLDGRTWSNDVRDGSGNVDGPQLFRDVAYANGVFVAVGGGCAGGCKGRITTTADGVAWQEVAPAGADNWIGGVAWGNGTWVAVGGFSKVLRSADAVTWTVSDVADGGLRAVRFGNGWFVAVGDDGRRRRSQDGLTWVDATTGGTGLGAVAYGGGVWVAAGVGGRRVRSTDDGATWTDDVTSDDTDSIAFAEGRFLASSEGSVLTSPDGAQWTPHTGRGASGIGFGAPGGAPRYVGFAWVATRLASDDGLTWSVAVPDDNASAFTSVAFGP